MAGLVLKVESRLAVREAVGGGTIVPVHGWCFHPEQRIRDLRLLVDGEPQVVLAREIPRPDVERAWRGRAPGGFSRRSGFWSFATLHAGANGAGRRRLELEADLSGGRRERTLIGEVEVVAAASLFPPQPLRFPHDHAAPRIAICMCTYQPPLDLLEVQIESIRAQSVTDWVCIVNDDGSDPDRMVGIERIVNADPRFHLRRNPTRLGFYRNYERVLTMVPPGVELVALADQDDRWHPDKLEVLATELAGGAVLAHSDVRVVNTAGRVLSETQWSARPPNRGEVVSQLVVNSVTGAACLFRAELLGAILPFPRRVGSPYHDHWLGSVAMASGEVRFVDRPLYDWIIHEKQVTSQRTWVREDRLQARHARSALSRLGGLRPSRVSDALALWRHIYFSEGLRVSLFARMVVERCSAVMTARRRHQIEELISADVSCSGIARLAWRRVRRRAAGSPTAGFETDLLLGHLWRGLASAAGRAGRHSPGGAFPPPPVAYGDEMVLSGPSALPLPPYELAWRVGPLDPGDPMADYERIGQRIHDQLVACLPDDWSWQGKRVLDLGCGAGRVLRHLLPYADQGAELHGCDIDRPSIEWLKANLSPPVHAFTNEALPPLPLPDGSIDLIIATSVFTHIYQGWSGWLLDLHRVLAPGGLMLATFLGSGMADDLLLFTGLAYDAERIGMLAIGSEGHYEWTYVWHGPWWLREHWGRAFEILQLQESGFADRPGTNHGWLLMRRRPTSLQPVDLERSNESQLARELSAAQLNVSALFKGQTQNSLASRLDELHASRSWRLTRPVRRAAASARLVRQRAQRWSRPNQPM